MDTQGAQARPQSRSRVPTAGADGEARAGCTIQMPLPVLAVLGDIRQVFYGLCISTGMQVFQPKEADRDVLCGPKGRHQPERTA